MSGVYILVDKNGKRSIPVCSSCLEPFDIDEPNIVWPAGDQEMYPDDPMKANLYHWNCLKHGNLRMVSKV